MAKGQTVTLSNIGFNGNSFEVNMEQQGVYTYSVQSAAKETIAFYPKGSSKPLPPSSATGVILDTYATGILPKGQYTCKITSVAQGGRGPVNTVKLIGNQYTICETTGKKMTMYVVCAEDKTDNDYNDVFLKIYYWDSVG